MARPRPAAAAELSARGRDNAVGSLPVWLVELVAGVQCREGAEASQHEKQLYGTLLRGYTRHARPVRRDADPVRVRVAFSLVEVLSIDEGSGQLAVKAWLTMVSRRTPITILYQRRRRRRRWPMRGYRVISGVC